MARRPRRADGPLRVAQICGAIDGAYWMVQIAEGLRARGYEVIAVIASADGETARNLERVGIRYVVFPHQLVTAHRILGLLSRLPYGLGRVRYLLDAGFLLQTGWRLSRILRRERIDITHTHVLHSIIVGRLGAAMARVPIRLAMVPGPYHLETELFRRLDLTTLPLDHRVIAGSRRTDELYAAHGVPARRRDYVHYGADTAQFDPASADGSAFRAELGVPDGAPLIGQVAYFYPVLDGPHVPLGTRGQGVKGHMDHVAAAKLVLEQRPDAHFAFVGDGWGPEGEQHRRAVMARARELGLEQRVHFLGRRSDIPDVLAAFDVSVQCSLNENYGGTIESLLMARPTIATRVGGMPEVVRHEETGLLVEPNQPRQLADAMLRLLDDRELAHRLAAAGRDLTAREFSTAACVDGVARVYREVAAERGLPQIA